MTQSFSRALAAVLSFLAIVALLFTAGCSPSTKGETQTWDNNKKKVAEYSAKWPGFKDVLEARMKKAEPMFEKAKKASGEEAQAEKMKEVNEVVGELTGRLDEVKYKSESLDKTITKINKLKLKKSKSSERKRATGKAHDVLLAVETAMKDAAPDDDAAALALLKEQISNLISAQGAADRALRSLKPSTSGGKKKKKKK